MAGSIAYDRRYLGGILFFNERDFFEAHEVWESLWLDCAGPERRFYQALIQAAVALYHYGNGNVRGATKLFRSSKAYMDQYASPYLGLNTVGFWEEMQKCFASLLQEELPTAQPAALREELIPTITLEPSPDSWPEMEEFETDEDEEA
jgi:predicted metal-dependent hydrolase